MYMHKKFSFLSLLSLLGADRSSVGFLRLGSNIAFVSDPELIRRGTELEKTCDLSRQAFTRFVTAPILGDEVFSSSEQDWRRHKKALSRQVRATASNIAVWRLCAREAASREITRAIGRQVNGEQFCRRIVQDTLIAIFFGRRDAADTRVFRLARRMDVCAELVTFCLLVFGRSATRILARPFWAIGARNREALRKLLERSRPEPGSPAHDPKTRWEMRSLLFAGQDTTTVSLCLLLWLLAKHPEHQTAVRRQVLEQGGDSILLRQSILETMQLFPPVHTPPGRTATVALKLGDKPIPKDTEVIYSLWFAHRRCDQPETFLPQRHVGGKCSKRFMPFGAGPKRCVGERLAMVVISEAAAEILKRASVSCEQRLRLGARTTLRPNKLIFTFEEVSHDR